MGYKENSSILNKHMDWQALLFVVICKIDNRPESKSGLLRMDCFRCDVLLCPKYMLLHVEPHYERLSRSVALEYQGAQLGTLNSILCGIWSSLS